MRPRGCSTCYLTGAEGGSGGLRAPPFRRSRRGRPRIAPAGHLDPAPRAQRQPQRRPARSSARTAACTPAPATAAAPTTAVDDAEHPASLLGKILRFDPRGGRRRPHGARRQPVRQRGLGVRPAQPVALLLRPRHRRPHDRRRRPGRIARRSTSRPPPPAAGAASTTAGAASRARSPRRPTPTRTLRRRPLCATRPTAPPAPPARSSTSPTRATASARSRAATWSATRACRRSNGRYLYGDFCVGQLRSLVARRIPATDARAGPRRSPARPRSARTRAGALYVAARDRGRRLPHRGRSRDAVRPHSRSGHARRRRRRGGPAGRRDTRKPSLSVRVRGLRSLVSRRRLRVSLVSDEVTAATVSGRLRGVARFKTVRRQLTAGKRRVIVLRDHAQVRAEAAAHRAPPPREDPADGAGPRRRRQPARRDPPPDAAPLGGVVLRAVVVARGVVLRAVVVARLVRVV